MPSTHTEHVAVGHLADQAEHAIRRLTHLTRPATGELADPADAAQVIAALAAMTWMLPQLLGQLAHWLEHEHHAGRLRADNLALPDPDQPVQPLASNLQHASQALRDAAEALDAAHQHAAHLAVTNPDQDPARRGQDSCRSVGPTHLTRRMERKSVCIYSQLKKCSSSEIAAMIDGLLRHCTDAPIDRTYVDTHGQSAVGFAFTELLGFNLLPRFKSIGTQRLYRPDPGTGWGALDPVLTRPIRWELIAQQYDQMVKYATALRLRTAESETILARFTRPGPQHPTYQALVELGRAVRSTFIAQYATSEALRREIHEGLQVVENWNSANGTLFYGKDGDLTGHHKETQETSMLALHLLQSSLVHLNTLLIQNMLATPGWQGRLTEADQRALSPLFWTHVNPYGVFRLDMDSHLNLEVA